MTVARAVVRRFLDGAGGRGAHHRSHACGRTFHPAHFSVAAASNAVTTSPTAHHPPRPRSLSVVRGSERCRGDFCLVAYPAALSAAVMPHTPRRGARFFNNEGPAIGIHVPAGPATKGL